ncbi:glycine cleavage system protein H [Planctomicrobium sp. SH668]|uniref:glycine cleavage system protein H n=1 Tax=Planctomicrobium sp. SH668 TaxID=3448126 RepID=UPI003F5C691D
MSEPIVFMMGEFPAKIPADRSYFRSHMWIQPDPAGGPPHVGLTAYAVRLLQDVYFLDWTIDEQTRVLAKQEIGEIESSKAISSVYAPGAGLIHELNPALLQDPSLINGDNYASGWLFSLETDAEVISAEEYAAHLNSIWEETQRVLKGQYNS